MADGCLLVNGGLMGAMTNKQPARGRLALYGLGSAGQAIASGLLAQGIAVPFIIDRAKAGQFWEGIPVLSLDDVRGRQDLASLDCLISLHNHYVDIRGLHDELMASGFRSVKSIIQAVRSGIAVEVPTGYWFEPGFDYAEHSDALAAVSRLLGDEESRALLAAIVKYRTDGEIKRSPPASLFDEYTPQGLPRHPERLRVIDCGAYTGVALEKFCGAGYKIDAYLAFEPDPHNYARLCLKDFGAASGISLPLGVWSSSARLQFSSNAGMGSGIDAAGDTVIQCVSGDEVQKHFAPNLIKFDVEGAEVEALHGFRRTIADYRPNLCVSVYHTPAHLFEIPLLIESWRLGYEFYLRVHEQSTFGVVLYCFARNS
jgi:FkbM family methyltransferase